MKIIMISLKAFGIILLLFATYISTITVSSLDKKIQEENNEIEKLQNIQTLAGISMLRASHIANQESLYLMEANIVGYTGKEKKRQIELREKALNTVITEIRNWNTFLSEGETSEIFQNAEKEMQEMLKDKDLTIEQKLEKAGNCLVGYRDEAITRLTNVRKERNRHKTERNTLEKDRTTYNNIFVWGQIFGLIFVGLSEIIEICDKKNPQQINEADAA